MRSRLGASGHVGLDPEAVRPPAADYQPPGVPSDIFIVRLFSPDPRRHNQQSGEGWRVF
jgi:hypothetical protein